MLKRLLNVAICACVALLISACGDSADNIKNLSKEQIYFFYKESCPHCHEAAEYIKEKYPHLQIKGLNVKMPGNQKLFIQAVKTYRIGAMAGTPLICFGNEYIMGWGKDSSARFDELSKPYIKE